MKGVLPAFDQGTIGINVLPLGSTEVRQRKAQSYPNIRGWRRVVVPPLQVSRKLDLVCFVGHQTVSQNVFVCCDGKHPWRLA